ncbi:hypothetical protein [Streptomyces sp. cg35]
MSASLTRQVACRRSPTGPRSRGRIVRSTIPRFRHAARRSAATCR